jgi:hypothetical protein
VFGEGEAMRVTHVMGYAAFATLTVMTAPAKSQFVADDSYAGIPEQHLQIILKNVLAEFNQPAWKIFSGLRAVKQGYCGYLNTTLDYDGFVPFYFDPTTLAVRLGTRGKLLDSPTIGEPEPCH